MRYVYNVLCWLDIGLNVLFGGDYRETCSSRLGRHYHDSKAARVVADAVDLVAFKVFGQADHCKKSIQPDVDHTAEVWD